MTLVCGLLFALLNCCESDRPVVIVVTGAPGTPEFGEQFHAWADLWESAASPAACVHRVGSNEPTDSEFDRDRLSKLIAEQDPYSDLELWIVLLGHGTFDGRTARFNLRGPDFAASDLASWLEPIKRPTVVINCSSSSAPFLAELSAPHRVVITSTRSGHEQNFSRFGKYLAESIANPAADLDKDHQTSIQESFTFAARQVEEFYKSQSRLGTEHPLIDDNGDQLGTPAEWFRGTRATERPADMQSPDGRRAHQIHLVPSESEQRMPFSLRKQRDELELEIFSLRDSKEKIQEEEYYEALELLAVRMAELYDEIDEAMAEQNTYDSSAESSMAN